MSTKQKLLFVGTFCILLAGRLAISGKGYLEDTDEFFYIFIHKHGGDASMAVLVKCVFDLQALFPDVIIRTAEYLSVKPLANALGKDMLHPDMLHIMGLYNIITSLFLLYIFFRILRKLDFGVEFALTGVLVLGTLFNYNLYTRHFLPYDEALVFHLLATLLLLKKDPTSKTFAWAGFFSALGLTTYFGSFMFLAINGGLVVLRFLPRIKSSIRPTILFILPHFLLFGLYEVLARMYENRSYLVYIRDYTETVNEGSFDEGLSYLFIYMNLVEKWWGVFLLALFFAGTIFLFGSKGRHNLKLFLGLGIVAYIVYGSYIYLLHKMEFHGRILHPYLLFVVIGALCSIKKTPPKLHKYFLAVFMCLATFNYVFVIQDFNHIEYPRHTIHKQSLFYGNGEVNIDYRQEINEGFPYNEYRSVLLIDSISTVNLQAGNYEAVNIAFLKHYPDDFINEYHPHTNEKDDIVIFDGLHFQSHPAYALEYCTKKGRIFFIDKKLHIKLLQKNNRN